MELPSSFWNAFTLPPGSTTITLIGRQSIAAARRSTASMTRLAISSVIIIFSKLALAARKLRLGDATLRVERRRRNPGEGLGRGNCRGHGGRFRYHVGGLAAEHFRERAGKRWVTERKATGQDLGGQNLLSAQQQLVGEVARERAQEGSGKSQSRRPAKRPAERLREGLVAYRLGGGGVDGPGELGADDGVSDQAHQIVALDPGHPLRAGAERCAEPAAEARQQAAQQAAFGRERQADPQPDHTDAVALRAARRLLPGLADAVGEAVLAAVELGQRLVLPLTIPADRGGADQHLRGQLEARNEAYQLGGNAQP